MIGMKDFLDDVFVGAIFLFTMARDVIRLLKEERDSETLCLYVD